jgi:hypothetical protein
MVILIGFDGRDGAAFPDGFHLNLRPSWKANQTRVPAPNMTSMCISISLFGDRAEPVLQ